MARERSTPEEIVGKLRQVEVLTGQGNSVAEAVRSIGVTEATYSRWRSEYGGLKLDQVKRLEAENARLQGGGRPHAGKAGAQGSGIGKLLSAARRRAAVDHVTVALGVSERVAGRVLGQPRSTQRKAPSRPDDEAALTADIISLARE
jgi:putative transposase